MINILGSIRTKRNFEILSENEMLKVHGGTTIKPKSRPKDVYDTEDEQN